MPGRHGGAPLLLLADQVRLTWAIGACLLQIPSGAVVSVRSVCSCAGGGGSSSWRDGDDEAAPPAPRCRLARLLALPEGHSTPGRDPPGAPPDGVAFLAPSLAFNLGLAPHLWPLLRHSSSGGASGGADRVVIERHTLHPLQQPSPHDLHEALQRPAATHWHSIPQPGHEPAAVPVAAEVHIAVVRSPAAAAAPRALLLDTHLQPDGDAAEEDGPPGGGGGQDGAAAPGSSDGGVRQPDSRSRRSTREEEAVGAEQVAAAADDAVAALQQWLRAAPRVVSQGDVLAVTRPPRTVGGGGSGIAQLSQMLLPNLSCAAAAEAASSSAVAAPLLELLYFRVAKLVVVAAADEAAVGEGEAKAAGAAPLAAAIQVGSTVVKLVGSCSSGLPVGLQHYLSAAAAGDPSSEGFSAERRSSMLGVHSAAVALPTAVPAATEPHLLHVGLLLPAWRQLAELLALVLHPAAAAFAPPLRLAVLVHGPSGSGKRVMAAAAAAAVGCHLIDLSCHEIKAAAGAAERHTFEGLRTAFGAAAEYAPAILLLRQLSVLSDGSTHGGSGSSGAHSYAARLGAVLSECIGSAHGSSGNSSDRGSRSSSTRPGMKKQEQQLMAAGEGLFPAPVVLVACTSVADELPTAVRRCFTHELALEAPDQQQRQQLLLSSLRGVAASADCAAVAAFDGANDCTAAEPAAIDSGSLEDTARHTAGLLPRELRAVAADAAAAATLLALPPVAVLGCSEVASGLGQGMLQLASAAAAADRSSAAVPPLLTRQHLGAAVEAVRQRTATDIGAPRIPSVRWEDVGGLHDVKRAILDTGGV